MANEGKFRLAQCQQAVVGVVNEAIAEGDIEVGIKHPSMIIERTYQDYVAFKWDNKDLIPYIILFEISDNDNNYCYGALTLIADENMPGFFTYDLKVLDGNYTPVVDTIDFSHTQIDLDISDGSLGELSVAQVYNACYLI